MSKNPVAELSEYELRYLSDHLAEAGRAEQLHRLLRLDWVSTKNVPSGRHINAWYERREQLGQLDGYVADVARAWRLAEEAFQKQPSPIHLGLQCRYALLTASLGSVARNVPPFLVSSLVEKAVWPVVQGWAYARQIPAPAQRAAALVRLAPYLEGSERSTVLREALASARVPEFYNYSSERAKTLIGIHDTPYPL